MSSNLKVIDKPFYPAQAEKSKAIIMVVLSFVVGLIVPAGVLVGAEVMDSSLKTPKNAAAATNLPTGGVLPIYPAKPEKSPIEFDKLDRQAMNLFLQELKVAAIGKNKPCSVTLCSIHPEEGKSMLIHKIQNFIRDYSPSDLDKFEFKEIPSLLNHPYVDDSLRDTDIHLLVARADRKWNEADQHALTVYEKFVGQKPLLFLNRVRTDIMEDITGEVPRKRSWLRIKIKSLLS